MVTTELIKLELYFFTNVVQNIIEPNILDKSTRLDHFLGKLLVAKQKIIFKIFTSFNLPKHQLF